MLILPPLPLPPVVTFSLVPSSSLKTNSNTPELAFIPLVLISPAAFSSTLPPSPSKDDAFTIAPVVSIAPSLLSILISPALSLPSLIPVDIPPLTVISPLAESSTSPPPRVAIPLASSLTPPIFTSPNTSKNIPPLPETASKFSTFNRKGASVNPIPPLPFVCKKIRPALIIEFSETLVIFPPLALTKSSSVVVKFARFIFPISPKFPN